MANQFRLNLEALKPSSNKSIFSKLAMQSIMLENKITMKKLIFAFFLLSSTAFMFSCQEEELTPNEDAAKLQQAGIDIHNNGGNIDPNGGGNGGGSGGGGTGGGGGATVDEYFTGMADGISVNESNPSTLGPSSLLSIYSNQLKVDNQFVLLLTGTIEKDTIDFPTITFFKSNALYYESYNGQIILDSVTTNLIQGTFYCDANAGNDTISITNGRFRVKR